MGFTATSILLISFSIFTTIVVELHVRIPRYGC
jgi:hypothetical protein